MEEVANAAPHVDGESSANLAEILHEGAIAEPPSAAPINAQIGTTKISDWHQAARHVDWLTGSADTECCFRLIHDSDRSAPARNFTGRLADLWPEIEAYQERGYGAFVVINEGGHGKRSITGIRANFIDG